MTEHRSADAPIGAEEAMNDALEAEQRALAAIEEREREAAQAVERAQQRARSILERTDRRIRDLNLRCVRATDERIAALIEADARESEEAAHRELEVQALGPAVARLAARLTGDPDER